MRRAFTLLAAVAMLCIVPSGLRAQVPVVVPGSPDYRFSTQTGVLVFHVHRDHVAAFEHVMERVAQGLRSATTAIRQRQAEGWRLFRARDTADSAVYVMVFDPVEPEADYDPVKMLTEFVPTEARVLYGQLRAAVMRVERLDLERIR
jgi:hypothetical protein